MITLVVLILLMTAFRPMAGFSGIIWTLSCIGHGPAAC
jgi:hypothetical protein